MTTRNRMTHALAGTGDCHRSARRPGWQQSRTPTAALILRRFPRERACCGPGRPALRLLQLCDGGVKMRCIGWTFTRAFTLLEIMIAISIFALVLTAIFSSWTAILRARKVAGDAAASVQRARISIRIIEDSLGSTESFVRNANYYSFVGENGSEASLSFVARLAKSFPRSGKFGDLDVRRLTFSVEKAPDNSRQLVLRQNPVLMDVDVDEKEHPLVLAKNVQDLQLQFWDMRLNDWTDEWTQTNQIPKLVMVTLKLSDNAYSREVHEEITRIISIPAMAVQPGWQLPMGFPGQQQNPFGTNVPPGINPGQNNQNGRDNKLRLQ